MSIAYFNKQFVPLAEANLSIQTNALHYGSAVFEGIRAYWSPNEQQMFVFRLPEHYERMLNSSKVLKLKVGHDVKELCALTVDLLRRNQSKEDSYIRPIAYVKSEGLTPRLLGYDTGFAIYTLPLGDTIDASGGLKAGFSSWRRIGDNSIPARCKISGGYVNSALAKTEALEQGYDEALLLTQDGFLSEGSAENIFLIRDGVLVTPDLSQDILEGVTRNTLISLCRDELDFPVIERQVGRTEVYVAEEVFLCGTGAQVSPVVEVDRRTIGTGKIGPLTARIQQLYFDVVRGRHPKYRHGCTPVY
jgi:branched-chain amino acid aminotransferase